MRKILLIEDEDHIREIYKEELESVGFFVSTCPTGNQGLDMFLKDDFDLVLLDLVLPDVNGLHILKEIKKNTSKKKIPIVILSNLDQDIVKRQGMEFGAEAYLEKVSNTPDIIVGKIEDILKKVSSQKSLKK